MPLRPTAGVLALLLLLVAGPAAAKDPAPLDPLYQRMAADLKAGKPLVITTHVALCDNRVIRCGTARLGDGDKPGKNLYWGGASGFRATFDHARAWRRVLLDAGDGEVIIQRAVYRLRIKRPSARWRALGVKAGFDVYLVGLGYRGTRIGDASDTFIKQVMGEGGVKVRLPSGLELAAGGAGHIVGYAGHNHLMDNPGYRFPAATRKTPLGFFALACMTAPYLARHLPGEHRRALLLTRTFMYPGAFTIDGLAGALAAGKTQQEVFMAGVRRYAAAQKRPVRIIRKAFVHDGEARQIMVR